MYQYLQFKFFIAIYLKRKKILKLFILISFKYPHIIIIIIISISSFIVEIVSIMSIPNLFHFFLKKKLYKY